LTLEGPRCSTLLATCRRNITRDSGKPVYLTPSASTPASPATVGSKAERVDDAANMPMWQNAAR
jgi:hypothetical protein